LGIISDLVEKRTSVEEAARKAPLDPAILDELVKGLLAKEDAQRYECYKVMLLVSERQPAEVYGYWKQFEEILVSSNSNFQSIAVQMLANLAAVDSASRFRAIFETYFSILGGEKTVTAAFLAANAWKIVLARPELSSQVTEKLLNIDKVHKGKQNDLEKGHAIESFSHYFDQAGEADRTKILEFVKGEAQSQSPRTKKAAKEFLAKWESNSQKVKGKTKT
jgi:hypothetical protein